MLVDDTVVVTVMANLGFRIGMRHAGIVVHETAVGDRYVLEALEAGAWVLGGEQSGHVIFRRLATTGDGLLTGLIVADLVRRRGRSLADLAAAAMRRLPQVLSNVRLERLGPGSGGGAAAAFAAAVETVERRLGEEGRVLVRPSGTEPLIRVMVEAAEASGRGGGGLRAGRRGPSPGGAGRFGKRPSADRLRGRRADLGAAADGSSTGAPAA